MKKKISFLTLLLLLPAFSLPANNVDLQLGKPFPIGDTIVAGYPYSFDILIENDFLLGGFSLGFIVFSTDGATWEWDIQPDGQGPSQAVTVISGSRLDPVNEVLDLTGLMVSEHGFDDGATADSILVGGSAQDNGLPPGGPERMISLHFTASGDMQTICIDSIYIPPAGEFVFTDEVGSSVPPGILWPTGGQCYPVLQTCNFAPGLVSGTPSAQTGHCSGLTVENAAAWEDPCGDPITIKLKQVVNGFGIAQVSDHGDGTCDVTYTPALSDVGKQVQVIVEAIDQSHATNPEELYTLTIEVTNAAPSIMVGNTFNPICAGSFLVKTDISASDIDDCDQLTFSLVSGPGMIFPETGEYRWMTNPGDIGVHTVVIAVSDGFNTTEGVFDVNVIPCEWYQVMITKIHDVYQGHYVDLPIILRKGDVPMGGFDFFLAYDQSLLTFTQATLGPYFDDCGWEYFSYRHGSHQACGEGCPSGEIRLIGLAETDNGGFHPDLGCIEAATATDETIVNLTFFVTNDYNANDQFAQVKFFWNDCGDNSISTPGGDTLAISRFVYDYMGVFNGLDSWEDITNRYWGFPGVYGAPNECIENVPEGKIPPIRFLDLKNGGIDIIDKDDIDLRGDINMNGLPNEIADAVMFTNYFISGPTVFRPHDEGSIAASDINADGTALTVADLVYLIRIITGDALPFPKPVSREKFAALTQVENGLLSVGVETTVDAGAALFIFNVNGETGDPVIHNDMDVVSSFNNGELRVLVYNIGTKAISSGQLLTIPITGSAEMISVEAADYNGNMMESTFRALPASFAVHQNYPNPFNPTTMLSFDLSVASQWTVDLYNIAGQKVNSFSGLGDPGTVQVTWDGTDFGGQAVASGIYFYKVTAGTESATKKMVLAK